jgi:hypothetical protein
MSCVQAKVRRITFGVSVKWGMSSGSSSRSASLVITVMTRRSGFAELGRLRSMIHSYSSLEPPMNLVAR